MKKSENNQQKLPKHESASSTKAVQKENKPDNTNQVSPTTSTTVESSKKEEIKQPNEQQQTISSNPETKNENTSPPSTTNDPPKEVIPVVNTNEQKTIDPPKETPLIKEFDLCICYSSSGQEAANDLNTKLNTKTIDDHPLVIKLLKCDENSNQEENKIIVCKSRYLIVLLTEATIKTQSVVDALRTALFNSIKIILVHDTSSTFPAEQDQPLDLQDVFHDKAITYLSQYSDTTADAIVTKITKKVTVGETRAFLSYKRSTGQGLTGRIYEGLKSDYNVFLDTEADFDLQQLKEIIENTHVFIIVLTEGILESFWCLQELRAAMYHHKPIIVIRDYQFNFPNEWPESLLDIKSVLTKKEITLSYMAEVYEQCLKKIKERLGPSDEDMKFFDEPALKKVRQIMLDSQYDVTTLPIDLPFATLDSTSVTLEVVLSAIEHYFMFPLANIKSIKNMNISVPVHDEAAKIIGKKMNKLLKVVAGSEISDDGLKSLSKCHSLEELQLDLCASVTDNGIKPLAKLATLKNLSFEGTESITSDAFQYLTDCKNLEILRISNAPKVGDEAFPFIATIPALKELWIGEEVQISDTAIENLVACQLRKFTVTSGSHNTITDESFKSFAKMTSLESLHLERCSKITGKDFPLLKFSLIKEIEIVNCTKMTEEAFEDFGGIAMESIVLTSSTLKDNALIKITTNSNLYLLKKLTLTIPELGDAGLANIATSSTIEDLHISSSKNLTDVGLIPVCSLEGLKVLSLSACTGIGDAAFCLFNGSFPLLETMHLYNLQLTNIAIQALAQNLTMSRLKNLHITQCGDFNDEGFVHFATSPFKLYKFSLYESKSFNNEAVKHLIEGHGESLEDLSLSSCPGLTDGACAYLSKCPNLNKLDLQYAKITSNGIKTLTSGSIQHLKKLDLTFCSRLNNDALKYLGESKLVIDKLVLDSCDKIEPEAFKLYFPLNKIELKSTLSRRQVLRENGTFPEEDTNEEEPFELPQEMHTMIGQAKSFAVSDFAICFASDTGEEPAKELQGLLLQKEFLGRTANIVLIPLNSSNEGREQMATVIIRSRILVLILSKDVLKLASTEFAVLQAVRNEVRVVLVHHQSSCPFPSYQEQPQSLTEAGIFNDKAIPYLQQYASTCVDAIATKMIKRKLNDWTIKTRAFLSHKRSSAQGMAGRIYEGLKEDYRVFLDSEAQFDLHDLSLIVKYTDLFIFILSDGILDSYWCMQELRSAVENKRNILIVRDYKYHLPSPLPSHVQDLSGILINTKTIDYMAEFYSQCITKIRTELGPTDLALTSFDNAKNKELKEFLLHNTGSDLVDLKYDCKEGFTLQEFLETLEYFLFDLQRIRKLAMDSRFVRATDDCLEKLASSCPNLESITLHRTFEVTGRGLLALSKCFRLKHLGLGYLEAAKAVDLKPIFEQLNLETLEFTQFMGTEVWEYLIKGNTSYKVLRAECNDDGFKQLVASNLPQKLEYLSIVWVERKSTDLTIQLFSTCQWNNLVTLDLNEFETMTDTGLDHLGKMEAPNLKWLNISWNNKITDEGLKNFTDSAKYELQGIDFDQCGRVNATGLKHVVDRWQNSLVKFRANKIDDALAHSIASCPNLEYLWITGASSTPETCFKILASGKCVNLWYLDLFSDSITDQAIQHLFTGNLFNITYLSMDTCSRITDEGLNHIGNGNSSNLKFLNVNSCNKISDLGIKHLVKGNCRNLQGIDLGYVEELTDESLETMASNPTFCENLLQITLQGKKMSNKGFKTLFGSGMCKNLKSVSVDCPFIGDEGILAIAENCPEIYYCSIGDCPKVTSIGQNAFFPGQQSCTDNVFSWKEDIITSVDTILM